MTDGRLRELERRWTETASVESEAEYLRERVRVGDLTQECLELAAYCGHEAAMLLTDDARALTLSPWDWLTSLAHIGWVWPARASSAVAVTALALAGDDASAVHHRAVEAIGRYLTSGTASACQRADRAWQRFMELGGHHFAITESLSRQQRRRVSSVNAIVFGLGHSVGFTHLPDSRPASAQPFEEPASGMQLRGTRIVLGDAQKVGVRIDAMRSTVRSCLTEYALRVLQAKEPRGARPPAASSRRARRPGRTRRRPGPNPG